jgi:bacterioferritin (cytochrome b1)
MFKLFIRILRDEKGFEWGSAAAGAATGAATGSTFGPVGTVVGGIGGAILGGLSKKKKKEEIYDPYAAQREQYKQYLTDKLGTSSEYEYNPEFEIDQPEIESAAEEAILGKIQGGVTPYEYSSDITQKYYDATKARQQASFDEEKKSAADMYNRLGLVSSTPGLQAQQNISEKQRLSEEELSSQLMYEDIARELYGTQMAEDIYSDYINKGLTLGETQRESEEYTQNMSMEDLARKIAEEQYWSSSMGTLLGLNPAERTVSYQPNTASQLLSVLQGTDLSSILK